MKLKFNPNVEFEIIDEINSTRKKRTIARFILDKVVIRFFDPELEAPLVKFLKGKNEDEWKITQVIRKLSGDIVVQFEDDEHDEKKG
ncbi:MAG: hypothetical protein ACTSVI_07100 [Promethearchaeota archaeon]